MTTKAYPEVIHLAQYACISDDEIAEDIAATEAEIRLHLRLKDDRAPEVTERRAFVEFLRRIQAARELQAVSR